MRRVLQALLLPLMCVHWSGLNSKLILSKRLSSINTISRTCLGEQTSSSCHIFNLLTGCLDVRNVVLIDTNVIHDSAPIHLLPPRPSPAMFVTPKSMIPRKRGRPRLKGEGGHDWTKMTKGATTGATTKRWYTTHQVKSWTATEFGGCCGGTW